MSIIFGLISPVYGSYFSSYIVPTQVAYFGLGSGYSRTNWREYPTLCLDISRNGGLSGRLFIGYDFTKYHSLEAGYHYCYNSMISTIERYAAYDYMHGKNAKIKIGDVWCKVKHTQLFDVVGKIKAPISIMPNFDIFAKYGIHYMMTYLDGNKIMLYEYDKNSINHLDLIVGFGLEHHISPNMVIGIEWLRYHGHYGVSQWDEAVNSKGGNLQPNADSFMTSISYLIDI